MNRCSVLVVLVLALAGLTRAGSGLASSKYSSTCETIPTEIHVAKDEYNSDSGLVRTCEANVAVNKCEGACASSIQPSALTAHGFLKECSCCREGSYRERTILLSSCFDSNGLRLSGLLGSLEVTIQEPVACQCQECAKSL